MEDNQRSFAHLPSWKHLLSVTLLGACLLALPALPAAADSNIDEWALNLEEIRTLVKAEKYVEAEAASRNLLDEISEKAVTGSALYPLIGKTMAYRAVAMMGQGKSRLAMWDFSVAQVFYPKILPKHLDSFGPAGKALHLHLIQSEATAETVYRYVEEGDYDGCEEFQPPKKTSKIAPSMPTAIRITLGREKEKAYTEVITELDAEGRPQRFHLVSESKYPTINLEASEEMRKTTFKPAVCDGQPVAFMYRIVMTFSIGGRPQKLEEAHSAP